MQVRIGAFGRDFKQQEPRAQARGLAAEELLLCGIQTKPGDRTPRHPRLAAAGFRLALPIAERFFRHKNIHRQDSQFAAQRSKELAARLARGETCYLAGVSIGGFRNTGAALVEVTPANGLRIIATTRKSGSQVEAHQRLSSRVAGGVGGVDEGFEHRSRANCRLAGDLRLPAVHGDSSAVAAGGISRKSGSGVSDQCPPTTATNSGRD